MPNFVFKRRSGAEINVPNVPSLLFSLSFFQEKERDARDYGFVGYGRGPVIIPRERDIPPRCPRDRRASDAPSFVRSIDRIGSVSAPGKLIPRAYPLLPESPTMFSGSVLSVRLCGEEKQSEREEEYRESERDNGRWVLKFERCIPDGLNI